MFVLHFYKNSEPPPLPLTHPPNPFGSGMASPPRGTPMKFTTFHQHHQLVAHPQHVPPINGANGSNNQLYQTQTIHVVNQQNFVVPPLQSQPHFHQQQQFFEYNQQLPTSSNYVSNNTYSRMSAPLGMNHFSQQSPRAQQFWNQQQQYMMRNDLNGNTNNIESG